MKKYLKRIDMSKVKKILGASRQALKLERQKNIAHLRWIADFRSRHKLDLRNKRLFRKYATLFKKLKRFEIKHVRQLLPVRG